MEHALFETRMIPRMRLADHVARLHLRLRACEWWSAVALLACGAALVAPGDSFAFPSWAMFHRFGWTETFWVGVFFATGTARFVALIINGHLQRVTPLVRMAGAMVGMLVWLSCGSLLFIGTAYSHYQAISLSVPLFMVFTLMELCSVFLAAVDVGTGI